MGGAVIDVKGRLLRFGQNNEGGYGESLSTFEIKEITPDKYQEEVVGSIHMEGLKGPHTINIHPESNKIIIDYYEDKFSILAWFRRVKAKLSKK